jgi:hypothetical protein
MRRTCGTNSTMQEQIHQLLDLAFLCLPTQPLNPIPLSPLLQVLQQVRDSLRTTRPASRTRAPLLQSREACLILAPSPQALRLWISVRMEPTYFLVVQRPDRLARLHLRTLLQPALHRMHQMLRKIFRQLKAGRVKSCRSGTAQFQMQMRSKNKISGSKDSLRRHRSTGLLVSLHVLLLGSCLVRTTISSSNNSMHSRQLKNRHSPIKSTEVQANGNLRYKKHRQHLHHNSSLPPLQILKISLIQRTRLVPVLRHGDDLIVVLASISLLGLMPSAPLGIQ